MQCGAASWNISSATTTTGAATTTGADTTGAATTGADTTGAATTGADTTGAATPEPLPPEPLPPEPLPPGAATWTLLIQGTGLEMLPNGAPGAPGAPSPPLALAQNGGRVWAVSLRVSCEASCSHRYPQSFTQFH